MHQFNKFLFNFNKLKYVKGERPDVSCILCAIRDHSPEVNVLEVYRTERFIVSVNLYPFNPGHLLLFPARHIEEPCDLSDSEALEMHHLTVVSISILREEFDPSGFNTGVNIGKSSGGSISHLHQHILPRYENEIGFIDVISGTRPVVADPVEIMEKLKKRFGNL